MRAFRILTLSVLAAATVATGTVSQAQTRRARPNPNTPPAPATAPAAAPIPPVAQAPGDIAPNALVSKRSSTVSTRSQAKLTLTTVASQLTTQLSTFRKISVQVSRQ
jgi:hypothetical protein